MRMAGSHGPLLFSGTRWLLAVILCILLTDAYAGKHKFQQGEKIILWANKVGPFESPTETYQYFDLPFCQPKTKDNKPLTLGEVVDGNRIVATQYDIAFRQDTSVTTLCKRQLSSDDLAAFRKAVSKNYYFQFLFDDLPAWGYVGKVVSDESSSKSKLLLFTHFQFELAYNDDRVIEINVSTDPAKVADISEGSKDATIEFSYSVVWKESKVKFAKRMDKYRKYQFLTHHLDVHWFSIINSCVTVMLLTGFLATILMRVLRKDFSKYSVDEEDPSDSDESGWKFVHGDVFRFPQHKSLFCAFAGTGLQVLVLSFFVFGLSLVGTFYPYNRGSMFTALILLYALTAGTAGYTSASYFKQMEGKRWVRNLLLTVAVFSVPLVMVFSFNNTVAWIYGSTAALPFGTIVVMLLLWLLVSTPLTIAGGVVGKNSRVDFAAPCRTNKYPREIPDMPWYRSMIPQMVMAGFLPFSAIYIELYYIFASVWSLKVYTLYSILFIVFCILLIVTAFVTIVLTYFQLAAEDHRWWWRSYMCGGSTGFFVYGYAIYYFVAKSNMSGFMQTAFYFGYNFIVCYVLFLLLGFVGWRASLAFVRRIYRAIKCE
jgi:hypothetical protein